MSWDLIEEATKIIKINSVTYESNKEIVDYLQNLLKDLDVQIELDPGELFNKDQFNLIVKKGPATGDALLFNTHLDTVSPGDLSLWDKTGGNPFRATFLDNKIFGLGTADVKLDILCKIKALEKFKGKEFKRPFILVGTYGEESGLKGAKQLAKRLKDRVRYAVVGEPSNLSIVYAHKGHLVLHISLTDTEAKELPENQTVSRVDIAGQSAHSSTPTLGVNAIEKACEFLTEQRGKYQFIAMKGGELINIIPAHASLWLQSSEKLVSQKHKSDLSVEKIRKGNYLFSSSFSECLSELTNFFKKISNELRKQPMEEFDPPYNLLNVGVTSTDKNKLLLMVGIRTLPSLDTAVVMDQFKNRMDQLLSKYPTIQGSVEHLRESLPMKTELDSKLVEEARSSLRELGLQDTVMTKATSTEASIYSRLGAEAIVWGPGISVGNVHKPNEYNYVHHLTHAVAFYEKLIEKFCIKGVK